MAHGEAEPHVPHKTFDAATNEAARAEVLRRDGRRSLGENLEQADALVRAAFELAAGMSRSGP